MHSSISNFSSVPDRPWVLIFGTAIIIFLGVVSSMECSLAHLGYQPTVLDSEERWGFERMRASKIGGKALILIGASRIHLGIDLNTVRTETSLEPIQLAADGSSFVPVLKNLADDPSITGTILIDYTPAAINGARSGKYGVISKNIKEYEHQIGKSDWFSLINIEKNLSTFVQERLRSYADGATPLMSLQWHIIQWEEPHQYLITLPDRSRLADYKKVVMPEFYYARVARTLSVKLDNVKESLSSEAQLRKKIDQLKPEDNVNYISGSDYIRVLVDKIKSRGGKVFFVEMPTSGMIKEIDEKSFPDAQFLTQFERILDVKVLRSAIDPTLMTYTCPDGSHLDYRDRASFTANMLRKLYVNRHN